MKIAIDVQTTLGQKSGFGFYVESLVKSLQKVDEKNQYLLIKPTQEKDLSTPQRFFWDQYGFVSKANRLKADIIHQPCFSTPIFSNAKKVVTINDLISVFFPQNIPFFSRLYYAKWMPFSYRFGDEFIAISEHTKKDILKLLKIPEEKITVIYDAAGDEFTPIKEVAVIERVKTKYNISGKYILHVGTLEPRKNLTFLVKVFAEVIKNPDIKQNLVIAGKKGWYFEGLFSLVQKLGLEKRVVFTGYIADEDKPALYSGASAFVFPSIYEGFGLPPLEAMGCGIPVLSSNTSSLPEVVGDAGILISPEDKTGWVKNLCQVLTDEKLQHQMSAKSLAQAKKFSWDKTAKETIKIYEKVILL